MEVQTPYLQLPITVSGQAPYHLELSNRNSWISICDAEGIPSVLFNYDMAKFAEECGVGFPAGCPVRPVTFSNRVLTNEGEHMEWCEQIVGLLNNQQR